MTDRTDFIEAATAAAWDERQPCPTCDGDGRIPGGRMIVHCRSSMFGADWGLDDVIYAIKSATAVSWVDYWDGHNLSATDRDGKTWRFEVRQPSPVGAGSPGGDAA